MKKVKNVIDYDLVCGMPRYVASRVHELLSLKCGWQPKGKPKKIQVDNTSVIVQCMVKYEN